MKKKEDQKPTQTVIPIKMCLLQKNSDPDSGGGESRRYDYSEN